MNQITAPDWLPFVEALANKKFVLKRDGDGRFKNFGEYKWDGDPKDYMISDTDPDAPQEPEPVKSAGQVLADFEIKECDGVDCSIHAAIVDVLMSGPHKLDYTEADYRATQLCESVSQEIIVNHEASKAIESPVVNDAKVTIKFPAQAIGDGTRLGRASVFARGWNGFRQEILKLNPDIIERPECLANYHEYQGDLEHDSNSDVTNHTQAYRDLIPGVDTWQEGDECEYDKGDWHPVYEGRVGLKLALVARGRRKVSAPTVETPWTPPPPPPGREWHKPIRECFVDGKRALLVGETTASNDTEAWQSPFQESEGYWVDSCFTHTITPNDDSTSLRTTRPIPTTLVPLGNEDVVSAPEMASKTVRILGIDQNDYPVQLYAKMQPNGHWTPIETP